MTKKIAKFAIIPFILLFAFFPGLILAQDEVTPTPIFGGGPSCSSTNSTCPVNYTCDLEQGRCVANSCSAAAPSCPEGYKCDLDQLRCVLANPEKVGVEGIRGALSDSQVVGTDNVRSLVIKYVNFALPLLALAAFIGFVYAGFLYVTAYGGEDQIGKAKKVMTYAVIGLMLVILSYSIVQLITVKLVESINK